jgi:hypothetical protein
MVRLPTSEINHALSPQLPRDTTISLSPLGAIGKRFLRKQMKFASISARHLRDSRNVPQYRIFYLDFARLGIEKGNFVMRPLLVNAVISATLPAHHG